MTTHNNCGQAMDNGTRLSKYALQIAAAILVVVISLGLITYQTVSTLNLQSTLQSYNGLAEQVRAEVIQYHLWLEERLAGNETISITSIYSPLTSAQQRLKSLRKTAEPDPTNRRAGTDQPVHEKSAQLSVSLEKMRLLGEQRLSQPGSDRTSSQDKEYYYYFSQVLQQTDELSTISKNYFQQEIASRNQISYFVSITLILILLGLFLFVAYNYWQRHQKDQQQIENRKHIELLFDQSSDALLVVDTNAIIERSNAAAANLFGYSQDELVGMPLETILDEQDARKYKDFIQTYLLAGVVKIDPERDASATHRNGNTVTVQISFTPIKLPHKTTFFFSIRDITSRKRIEQHIRDNESYLNAVIDTAVDGIITISEKGIIKSFNQAAESMFGYKEREVKGKNISILMTSPDANNHDNHLNKYMQTGKAAIVGIGREVIAQRKDGRQFPMDLSVAKVEQKGRLFYTGIVRDVSERHAAQQHQARQQQLLDVIRQGMQMQMTGVSHTVYASYMLGEILQLNDSPCGFIGEVINDSVNSPVLRMHAIINLSWDNKTKLSNDEIIYKGMDIPVSDNLLGTTLSNRDATIIDMSASIPRATELTDLFPEIESFLGIPLHFGNDTIGIYGLANRPGGYNTEHVEFLQPFTLSYSSIINHKRSSEREHDITKDLLRAKTEAEKSNQAKTEFLSRMSHELRTPLNAIIGFSQLLAISELTAEQADGIKHIENAGKHLTNLINEVLDIARIEAGRHEYSLEAVHINQMFEDVNGLVSPLTQQRQMALNVEDPGQVDIFVLADAQQLKQVLLNFLSNAIKYGRNNGNIVLTCNESTNGFLRISVQDDGYGIDANKLDRVFEPFDRLDAAQTNIVGTGVGLALSKALIEGMSGRIGVDSQVGKGSTFWIELPIYSKSEKPGIAMETNEAPPIQLTSRETGRHKLLYIEDNPINIQLLQSALKDHQHLELHIAEHGASGLELIPSLQPDIILLDLHLPDIAGDEILNRIKLNQALQHIPVIILSADATKYSITRLMDAGAYAYLTKPLNIQDLYTKLNELFN